MVIDAVELEPSLDLATLLLQQHAVGGGQHANRVTAQLEIVYYGFATQIKSARVMRRVKVCQNKDFHPRRRLVGEDGMAQRFRRHADCSY
jgi:hypothetical protein